MCIEIRSLNRYRDLKDFMIELFSEISTLSPKFLMTSIEQFKKKGIDAKKGKQAGRTTYQKELQQIRDTCSLLKHLSTAIQLETKYRRNQDYADLRVINIDIK